LEELHTWRNPQDYPIQEWLCASRSGISCTLNLGEDWPVTDFPVQLSANTKVPEEWVGHPIELELWLGGEGFVRLSTGVEGGLDPFHRSFHVTDAARGGEPLEIQAEVVPKGLFGSHIREPRLERACLVVPEAEVRALESDLRAIVDACTQLKDHDVVPHLLDVLDLAFASLAADWPSASEVTLTRFHQEYTNQLGHGLWSLPPAFATEAVDVNRMGRELWNLPPPRGRWSLCQRRRNEPCRAPGQEWPSAWRRLNKNTHRSVGWR